MKQILSNIKTASLAVAMVLCTICAFTSCVREPLEIVDAGNSFDLIIRPRWIEMEERPTGFTAIIYPTDGSTPKTVISNNVDSICVSLPAGGYRVLVFNQTMSEYHSIDFRHMESYYDSEIMMTENPEKCNYNIMGRSTWANEPAIFAADCCNELYVSQHEIDAARGANGRLRKILTMRPHIIISTLYVNLRVDGIYNGYAIEGCIDGMSGNVFPVYFEAGDRHGAFQIKDWKVKYDGLSQTKGYYQGTVRVFGMPGTSLFLSSAASIETQTVEQFPQKHKASSLRSETDPTFKPEDILLHMRVLLVDQKTVQEQTFAVGDLIQRRINDPLILDLYLDEPDGVIVLPYVKPATGSGSSMFDADVDDWQVIDTNVSF